MDFVAPSKSLSTIVKDFFSPPNRATCPAPRTQQRQQTNATPIGMRSLKQQFEEGGYTPMVKKASDPFSFANRFQLLILSIRIKHTKSASALEALKADIKTAIKELDRARYPAAYGELEVKKLAVENSLRKLVAQQSLLFTDVPTYQGFVPARFRA